MSNPIRVVPNFLSPVECAAWIQLINELEQTVRQKFVTSPDARRIALQFGLDYCEENSSDVSLSPLGEKEHAARQLFSRIVKQTGSVFADSSELHVCAFWLAKQYPGAQIGFHEDTDNGANPHMEYSAVIYLNTQQAGGELKFPRYGYTYSPVAGDVVIFPSKEAGLHGVLTINEDRYSLPVWLTRDPAFALS
jgi:2OG-Fe(II) oxygenase superfamily